MASVFSAPALVPSANLPPRSVDEVARTPASQSREAPSGAATANAPQGKGAPPATGAEIAPTGVEPQPAPPPPVSVSQTGRVAESAVDLQARIAEEEAGTPFAVDDASETEKQRAPEQAQAERTERERGSEEAPPSKSSEPPDRDPVRDAAQQYRDAAETTSGAEPAQLLMDA